MITLGQVRRAVSPAKGPLSKIRCGDTRKWLRRLCRARAGRGMGSVYEATRRIADLGGIAA